jgi:hypothetical protein
MLCAIYPSVFQHLWLCTLLSWSSLQGRDCGELVYDCTLYIGTIERACVHACTFSLPHGLSICKHHRKKYNSYYTLFIDRVNTGIASPYEKLMLLFHMCFQEFY